MPVQMRFVPALHLVVVTCSGRITDADWRENFARLWNDPAFDRTFDKLIDTRLVTEFWVKGTTILEMGGKARQLYVGIEKSKTAVVAPLPAVHGAARQHELSTEGMAPVTQVFWTYDEACAWLGQDPDRPAPGDPA